MNLNPEKSLNEFNESILAAKVAKNKNVSFF